MVHLHASRTYPHKIHQLPFKKHQPTRHIKREKLVVIGGVDISTIEDRDTAWHADGAFGKLFVNHAEFQGVQSDNGNCQGVKGVLVEAIEVGWRGQINKANK